MKNLYIDRGVYREGANRGSCPRFNLFGGGFLSVLGVFEGFGFGDAKTTHAYTICPSSISHIM